MKSKIIINGVLFEGQGVPMWGDMFPKDFVLVDAIKSEIKIDKINFENFIERSKFFKDIEFEFSIFDDRKRPN